MRGRWVAGVVLAAAGAGCGGSSAPAATTSSSAASVASVAARATLPADPLAHLVPQPDEVPAGLILVGAQSGPRDAQQLAAFSGTDSAATLTQLRAAGFSSAYVVEYASTGGRTLTVVVSKFDNAAGAGTDLAGDLAGTTPQTGIGDRDGEEVQALPGGPAGGQLVTERFRVGALTFLVAAGGPMGVDVSDVRSVAGQLAKRAAG